MGAARYVTLGASLPALGPVLAAKVVPINRARLDARLRGALVPDDLRQLDAVRGLLSWPNLQHHADDGAALVAVQRTMDIVESADIRAFLRDRMELRTLIAALRRRAAGAGPPANDVPWGFGRYQRRMRANWSDPAFGVGRAFPWAAAAAQAMGRGDSAGVERIVLEAAWRQAERRAAVHRFDFDSIVFYVARWALLDRWTRYDAEVAEARFGDLLETAAMEAAR
jgi:hypothetical protein